MVVMGQQTERNKKGKKGSLDKKSQEYLFDFRSTVKALRVVIKKSSKVLLEKSSTIVIIACSRFQRS